ncbi:Ig-like domain-containing protein [Oceanithermus sp.]
MNKTAIISVLLIAAFLFVSCNSDGTPPKVVSLDPAPASEANLARPLTAVFSEPLDPSSVSGVRVLAGSSELACQPTLAGDGKTLTITIMEEPSAFPAQLNVDLSALKDRAGNRLEPLASPWQLQAPRWLVLENYRQLCPGGACRHNVRVSPAGDGFVYAAYSSTVPEPTDRNTSTITTFAYRVSENGHQDLGSYQYDPGCDQSDPTCTDASGIGSIFPHIVIDADGRPVIASTLNYTDSSGNFAATGVGISRLQDGAWQRLSDPIDIATSTGEVVEIPYLTAGPGGELALVYTTNNSGISYAYFAVSADGIVWNRNGTPLNQNTSNHANPVEPAFAPDGSEVAVAWTEGTSPINLLLRYCTAQGSCSSADTVTSVNSGSLILYKVSYREDGSLLFLYNDSDSSTSLTVEAYKNLSLGTTTVPTSSSSGVYSADLFYLGDGSYLVAWSEIASPQHVYLASYDGSSWGPAITVYTAAEDLSTENLQVSVNDLGQPVVHWSGYSNAISNANYYDYTAVLNTLP